MEFTVTITKHPNHITNQLISIPKNDKDDKIVLHQVELNSASHQLGLSIGDELLSINNISVSDSSLEDICEQLHSQQLPFNATFAKFDDHTSEFTAIDDDSDDNDTKLDVFSIFTEINIPATSITPSPHTPNSTTTVNSPIQIPDSKTESDIYLWNIISDSNPVSEYKNTSDTNVISEYIHQDSRYNTNCNKVCFDRMSISKNKSRNKICIISSNGFKSGYYEWCVEILQSNAFLQEIGVISVNNIGDIEMDCKGIKNTKAFKARAVFGNATGKKQIYYGSWNENNEKRCWKKLSNDMVWNVGDVIMVSLDLEKGSIKYFLNGNQVRKKLSLEKNVVYYPCIAFSGNCQFGAINLYHQSV